MNPVAVQWTPNLSSQTEQCDSSSGALQLNIGLIRRMPFERKVLMSRAKPPDRPGKQRQFAIPVLCSTKPVTGSRENKSKLQILKCQFAIPKREIGKIEMTLKSIWKCCSVNGQTSLPSKRLPVHILINSSHSNRVATNSAGTLCLQCRLYTHQTLSGRLLMVTGWRNSTLWNPQSVGESAIVDDFATVLWMFTESHSVSFIQDSLSCSSMKNAHGRLPRAACFSCKRESPTLKDVLFWFYILVARRSRRALRNCRIVD